RAFPHAAVRPDAEVRPRRAAARPELIARNTLRSSEHADAVCAFLSISNAPPADSRAIRYRPNSLTTTARAALLRLTPKSGVGLATPLSMPAAAVPSTHTTTWDLPRLDRSVASRIGVKTAFLLITSVLAFGLRAGALSTYGFSEDEINKVRAIEQYRQGQ